MAIAQVKRILNLINSGAYLSTSELRIDRTQALKLLEEAKEELSIMESCYSVLFPVKRACDKLEKSYFPMDASVRYTLSWTAERIRTQGIY